jgi:hypothetical protein
MAQQCLTWNDATLTWLDANITWVEACVISKIVNFSGPLNRNKKLSKFVKNLPEEDKKVLIGLITRIKTEQNKELVITSNKSKNTDVDVTIKDMKLFIKEIRQINVKVIV